VGYPDFLIRHASGEYQPADAKLSLSVDKKEIQVQLLKLVMRPIRSPISL